MDELVYLKRDDAFTDSMVIANGTGNQHNSVMRLIKKQRAQLEKFGKIEFMDLKSKNPNGGRPIKYCTLNEPQATLLVTFLDNTDAVVEFKTELVRQFFEMRKFIAERHTKEWIETRQHGKLTRRKETDVIQELVGYAKAQHSEHAEMLFTTYSKLANSMVGIKGNQRNQISVIKLNELSVFENLILQMILNGMQAGLHYKDIYKECKNRCEQAKKIAMIGGSTWEEI